MLAGIMQPYFFPNLSHFALIATVNEWVVFDVTQYTRKSWMNRNRILHPDVGWQYISVPLAKSTISMLSNEARVADLPTLHKTLLGKLSHYKKSAPNYGRVLDLVNNTFSDVVDDRLVSLNVSGLKAVCQFLDIPFKYRICSEMGLEFPEQMGPGDWAPFIAAQLGADAYVNPVGGRDLFNPGTFKQIGIALHFAEFREHQYNTPGYEFVPGLSILDVLMWNETDVVRRVVRDHINLIHEA